MRELGPLLEEAIATERVVYAETGDDPSKEAEARSDQTYNTSGAIVHEIEQLLAYTLPGLIVDAQADE